MNKPFFFGTQTASHVEVVADQDGRVCIVSDPDGDYVVHGPEYPRAKHQDTGQALVVLFADTPLHDVVIERESSQMPVRDVEL
jgi:hypothetical protein